MYFLFFLLSLVFFWVLNRIAGLISDGVADYLIKFFVAFTACIIPTGFVLSTFNWINQPMGWALGGSFFAFIVLSFFQRFSDNTYFSFPVGLKNSLKELKATFRLGKSLVKVNFVVLGIGLIAVTIINLITFFWTVPNEWDSMTGHLVKCLYYLQNGNMDEVQGTTWSIDYYPNALPTMQLFFYHLFGEKGFKVIHFVCYWLFPITTYGIAKLLTDNKLVHYFTFLLTALLPTALVQATTTETDIILTSVMGVLVYFMLRFKALPVKLYGVLIMLTTVLWMSMKVTFLLIAPAVLVLALYTFLTKKEFYKHTVLYFSVFVIGVIIYVLPTGYIGNIQRADKLSLGALSAPSEVMAWHGVESYSTAEKLTNFKLNVIRYTSEFLNFDGIRATSWGRNFNDAFRSLINPVFTKFNIVGDRFTVVGNFQYEHPIRFYLERPFWGVIGFGIALPIIFILLFNFRKMWGTYFGKTAFVLLAAALVHFVTLCFTAPYDPIKARYFMNMAVWILPICGGFYLLKSSTLKDGYLLLCSLIIVLSAVSTTLYKRLHPYFGEKNIFNMSRMEQLTVSRPEIYSAYKKFDELVPENAIVALGTQQEHEDFEYPLWGKNFNRTLIPLHPFRKAVKPIPANAEYLFYSEGVFDVKPGDIELGKGNEASDTPVEESKFYLRVLNEKK